MENKNDVVQTWNNVLRTNLNDPSVLLDENSPYWDKEIPGLIGKIPFRHQLCYVQALLDIEKNNKFNLAPSILLNWLNNMGNFSPSYWTDGRINDLKMETTSTISVLAGRVGIGKTLIVLMFVLLKIRPKNRMIRRPIMTFNQNVKTSGHASNYYMGDFHEVEYADKNVLPITLVFCNTSNLKSTWVHEVKTSTNLRYTTITNMFQIQHFFKTITDGGIDQYDIIIIKNGTSKAANLGSGITDLNAEVSSAGNKDIPPISSQITSFLVGHGLAVDRVFWDDYDTAKDSVKKCFLIPACHHHVVSATNDFKTLKMNLRFPPNITLWEEIRQAVSPSFSMTAGELTSKGTGFRCTEKFIEDGMNMPRIEFYAYHVNNPHKRQFEALGELGADVHDIREQMNAGDIKGAAGKYGCDAGSAQDIVQFILRNEMDKYAKTKANLNHLEYIKNRLLGYSRGQVNLESTDVLTVRLKSLGFTDSEKVIVASLPPNEQMNVPQDGVLRINYTDYDLRNKRELNYKHPGVGQFRKERLTHYEEQANELGKKMDRVIDKLKEGNCPICRMEIEDVAVAGCCGATYCANCAFTKSGFHQSGNNLIGTCNNCTKRISIKQYLFVGKDIDLKKLDDIGKMVDDTKEEPPPTQKEKGSKVDWKTKSKMEVLKELLINGNDDLLPSIGSVIPTQIENLVRGTKEPEPVEAKDRKFIIFANYENTLGEAQKILKDEKLDYVHMQGSVSQMFDAYEKFATDPNCRAITINSSANSSGLNLQMATDIIFMHKIQNKAIEEQAVGRIYRLGKRNCARVHYILFDGERRY